MSVSVADIRKGLISVIVKNSIDIDPVVSSDGLDISWEVPFSQVDNALAAYLQVKEVSFYPYETGTGIHPYFEKAGTLIKKNTPVLGSESDPISIYFNGVSNIEIPY